MFDDLYPIDDRGKPLYIAGPCAAESREQLLTTARAVAAAGVGWLRAGVWKPRTRPGSFEGAGDMALQWLADAKSETGLRTMTEVATPQHVEAALASGIDAVWIGARTTTNPFAVQQIADALQGVDIPVLVKNPVNPDVELWIGAVQRIYNAGIRRLAAIHRGFGSYEQALYRNPPHWSIPIELRRRIPSLPIVCDPSHMAGRADLVEPLAQQAISIGFDGLIVESHCAPESAWSDKEQQITPAALAALRRSLVIRRSDEATESLHALRREIDKCDDELLELLARRMRIARDIGRYKKEHAMPVLQAERYNDLLDRRAAQACDLGMERDFIRTLLQAIHEESVRQQMHVLGE